LHFGHCRFSFVIVEESVSVRLLDYRITVYLHHILAARHGVVNRETHRRDAGLEPAWDVVFQEFYLYN